MTAASVTTQRASLASPKRWRLQLSSVLSAMPVTPQPAAATHATQSSAARDDFLRLWPCCCCCCECVCRFVHAASPAATAATTSASALDAQRYSRAMQLVGLMAMASVVCPAASACNRRDARAMVGQRARVQLPALRCRSFRVRLSAARVDASADRVRCSRDLDGSQRSGSDCKIRPPKIDKKQARSIRLAPRDFGGAWRPRRSP